MYRWKGKVVTERVYSKRVALVQRSTKRKAAEVIPDLLNDELVSEENSNGEVRDITSNYEDLAILEREIHRGLALVLSELHFLSKR